MIGAPREAQAGQQQGKELMTGAADDIIALYRRQGPAWAAARNRRLYERGWLDRFATLARPGATLLDIGCGAGDPIARYLRDKGHPVTGVDAAPEMLALFRENLPDATAEQADMRGLDLGRAFGGLIAWDSFFHLAPGDQRGMFPVFRIHAEPGAPLLFTSGPSGGEAIGTLAGEPLYHASLDPDEYRDLLDANGFYVVDHVPEDPACTGHTVWLARRRGD
ncbi:methyltransferase [Allosediminivita pacifica]|uniref:Methyltransferase family protein n=2 Tax=Allosediminivita pacifica TaxID=1267769 RepID=A0A2T6AX65_9RHOB|nr:methyltransferase family protein [Allosediminivita pacifica]GGB10764.1 methyltransferase [Allosediminivita pacifica]